MVPIGVLLVPLGNWTRVRGPSPRFWHELGREGNVEGYRATCMQGFGLLFYQLIGVESGSEYSKTLDTGGVTVLSSSDPAASQLNSRTDIYGCSASPCIGSPGDDLYRFEKIPRPQLAAIIAHLLKHPEVQYVWFE